MKNQLSIAFAAIILFTAQSAFAEAQNQLSLKPQSEEKTEKVIPYPLDTCIVSDDKLGKMGKPFVFIHEGQEIKLCCEDCRADFDKEPAKYLKKLDKK